VVEVRGETVTFLTPQDHPLSPEPVGDGRWVVVSVSDEGLGIPKEAMSHLFERFFRVDSSDRREIKGAGLGLAICQEIITVHGGRIWAESEEGVGSTFWFTLPSHASQR
jgi:signal transduction histidine kinase